MKTTLTAIMITICLLTPALCFSAYRIHLKDGREFVTDRYWEEGDQIKFERFGGEVGISKNLVSEIEEVEDIPEQGEAGLETPGKKMASQAEEKEKLPPGTNAEWEEREEPGATQEKERRERGSEDGKLEEKKKGEQCRATEIDVILEQKKRILVEIKRFSSDFREAKKINDNTKKEESWNRLRSLQKKLSQLRKKVMAEHDGVLPSWWKQVQ